MKRTDTRDVIYKAAFALFMFFAFSLLFAIFTTLSGCSALHPSDEIPDVTRMVNGHKWEGYRTRHKGTWMHARDCPHESHKVTGNPDSTYDQSTIYSFRKM